MVMVLVTLLQTTKDGDGRGFVRLVHHHDLETTFQSLVFLKILLVFLQGGGTDALQLATRQGGLQDVGGIHGTAGGACTDKGVDLVDEQHHVAGAVNHLFDDALQTFLEFALVLGTSDQGAHVKRKHHLTLQVLRHVAVDDTLGEAFHDGGLADARLTDQNRVVFRTARQDLQHTPYLFVSTYHRVELAVFCQFIQILGVTVQ